MNANTVNLVCVGVLMGRIASSLYHYMSLKHRLKQTKTLCSAVAVLASYVDHLLMSNTEKRKGRRVVYSLYIQCISVGEHGKSHVINPWPAHACTHTSTHSNDPLLRQCFQHPAHNCMSVNLLCWYLASYPVFTDSFHLLPSLATYNYSFAYYEDWFWLDSGWKNHCNILDWVAKTSPCQKQW